MTSLLDQLRVLCEVNAVVQVPDSQIRFHIYTSIAPPPASPYYTLTTLSFLSVSLHNSRRFSDGTRTMVALITKFVCIVR